ncbi:3-carboxyethylcatechol 2,3-dioxygenase [Actinomadura sp. 7K507]|uniref:3-carboxyethylcatechol 2,3-dioxygenase n=1 Tax=Actinomadura sp. 7K507 TaxID=2530365 RepID=UPI0010437747|nr:3-carboxyethylcatechol 2,3-dioxygenase [Actinomadura sp. 7K507]TDC85733.1 3-carboxyethylcatechol 2,3-dioxygenase [Actinomadura sp. 7K507]
MRFALAAVSHAPTLGRVDPGGTIYEEILAAIGRVQEFVTEFDPEIVVSFGPDHFNGVLYEMMPSFCIGAQAEGIGDWGTAKGPLPVDSETARRLHAGVLAQGIDVARSEMLKVDHGMLQTMEFIFGKGFTKPFVPVFVNCVGLPLGPMRRMRLFGEAMGATAKEFGKRVLFLASGGLSHDPPIPVFDTAPAPVRARLTSAVITPEQRAEREAMIMKAAHAHARGEGGSKPVNDAFDRELLRVLASGDLSQADAWQNDWVTREGGSGAQEVRTWLAAFSSLSALGGYSVVDEGYWPSVPWGAGFGVVTARSAA